MKENRYDRILAKMFSRIERVSDRMAREFKGSNPFDKEKMSDEDRIKNYARFLSAPEVEKEMSQTMGDDAVNQYHAQMTELIRRKYNA